MILSTNTITVKLSSSNLPPARHGAEVLACVPGRRACKFAGIAFRSSPALPELTKFLPTPIVIVWLRACSIESRLPSFDCRLAYFSLLRTSKPFRMKESKMTKCLSATPRLVLLLVLLAILMPFAATPARAQSLPDTTIALYPPEAGELAYADLHALRQSPHYRILHDSYLPSRLQQLEHQALSLGIDYEAQSQQLSWAYVASAAGG